MNDTFEKRNFKLNETTPFLPYILSKAILKETDINKEIVEEQNSELWYEALHGRGTAIFSNLSYKGNITYGILDSRVIRSRKKQSMSSRLSMSSCSDSDNNEGLSETTSEITFPDGTIYKGTIHNNKIDGKGQFIFPTGSTYMGEVKEGLRDGVGTYVCEKKGISYEGEWKKGTKHGKGKLTKKDMIYEGEWSNGIINGKGKCRWLKNNNYYDGMFINGLLSGNGFLVWNSVNEKYIGGWLDNKQSGIGMQIWYEPKGEIKLLRNRYVGYWREGKRNGYGVFFYANGSKYEGYWEDDSKKGFGIFSFLDRSMISGIFDKDRLITPIDITKEPAIANKGSGTTSNNNSMIKDNNTSYNKLKKVLKSNITHSVVSSDTNTNSNVTLDEKKRNILKQLSSNKIYIDISDLILLYPSIQASLKEIDNILLRNLSDISHWYSLAINRDIKEIDIGSIISTENSKQITYNADDPKKPLIETAITNNDYSFCMELRDLWKFLRDITAIVNYDFTLAEVNRIFYIGRNYYEMFYIKEGMITQSPYKEEVYTDDNVYDYLYMMVRKEKYDFDCKYSKYSNNTVSKEFDECEEYKDIHNRRNIVLLKHFYEIMIRVALFKQFNYDNKEEGSNDAVAIEEKMKKLFLYIKPIMRLKRKSVNYSKAEASSVSSHSAMGDGKTKNIDSLFEAFIILYESVLLKIFDDIYLLSTDNPNLRNKTITYNFLYKKILIKIKNDIIQSLIKKKSSYCELLLSIPAKTSFTSNANMSSMSALKRSSIFTSKDENASSKNITKIFSPKQEDNHKKYTKLLDNEMIAYEFIEFIFFLSRKYFIASNSKEDNYNEVIEIIRSAVEQAKIDEHIKQEQRKGKKAYWYPKLKAHYKIEENERKRQREIEERIKKQKEIERYTIERSKFKAEDNNVYKEENSKEESDEDDYSDM